MSNDQENDDLKDDDTIDENTNEEENYSTSTVPNTTKGPICNVNIRKGQGELAPRISSVQAGSAEEAGFGEWPNMCIILKSTVYRGDNFDLYQCGASLISPGIVLTAAHCVE